MTISVMPPRNKSEATTYGGRRAGGAGAGAVVTGRGISPASPVSPCVTPRFIPARARASVRRGRAIAVTAAPASESGSDRTSGRRRRRLLAGEGRTAPDPGRDVHSQGRCEGRRDGVAAADEQVDRFATVGAGGHARPHVLDDARHLLWSAGRAFPRTDGDLRRRLLRCGDDDGRFDRGRISWAGGMATSPVPGGRSR